MTRDSASVFVAPLVPAQTGYKDMHKTLMLTIFMHGKQKASIPCKLKQEKFNQ